MVDNKLKKMGLFLGIVFLIGVFLIPPLCPVHTQPMTSFWTEWLAGLLMLTSFSLIFVTTPKSFVLPKVFWVWLAWGISLTLSVVANHYDLWQPVIFEAAFWAMGLLSLLVGSQLAAQLGRERILTISAYALLVVGLLQAVLGLARHYGLLANLSIFLRPLATPRLDGLFNYPTLTGFSLWLSICALMYLFIKQRLNWIVFFLCSLIMTIPIIATGDRASVLYWGGLTFITILVLLRRKYGEESYNGSSVNTKKTIGAVILISATLVCSIPLYKKIDSGMIGYMHSNGYSGVDHKLSSLYNRKGHFWGIRSSAFRKAFVLARQAPYFGIGPSNYTYHGFLLNSKVKDSLREGTIDTHTHNIFSMLLAENGFTGVIVLVTGCFFVALWWWRLGATSEAIFIGSVLVNFFVYSNLEYPLWYLNFLVIFMVFCGFLSPYRVENLKFSMIKPVTGICIALGGGYFAWRAYVGYTVLSVIPQNHLASMADAKKLQKWFSNPMWAAEAGLIFEQVTIPTTTDIPDQISLAQQVMEYLPSPPVLIHKAMLLEFEGNQNKACRAAFQAANSYPSSYKDYQRITADYVNANPKISEGLNHLDGCFRRGFESWQNQWR